jgi:hypothetical protein
MIAGITMNINAAIDLAISIGLRPNLSITNIAGMVKTRNTTPVTPVARSAVVPPVRPKSSNKFEA